MHCCLVFVKLFIYYVMVSKAEKSNELIEIENELDELMATLKDEHTICEKILINQQLTENNEQVKSMDYDIYDTSDQKLAGKVPAERIITKEHPLFSIANNILDSQFCDICCNNNKSNPNPETYLDDMILEILDRSLTNQIPNEKCTKSCKKCRTQTELLNPVEQKFRNITREIIRTNNLTGCENLSKFINGNLINRLNEIINLTFYNNGKVDKFDCLLNFIKHVNFEKYAEYELLVIRNLIIHFLEYQSLFNNDVLDIIRQYTNIIDYYIEKLPFSVNEEIHHLIVSLKYTSLQQYVLNQIDLTPTMFEMILIEIYNYDVELLKDIIHNLLINKITSATNNEIFYYFDEITIHGKLKFMMLKAISLLLRKSKFSELTLNFGLVVRKFLTDYELFNQLNIDEKKWMESQKKLLPNCIRNLIFGKFICLRYPIPNKPKLFKYVYYKSLDSNDSYIYMSEAMINPPNNSFWVADISILKKDHHGVIFRHPKFQQLTLRLYEVVSNETLFNGVLNKYAELSEMRDGGYAIDTAQKFHVAPYEENEHCSIYWSSYFLQTSSMFSNLFGENISKFSLKKITLWDIIDCTKFYTKQ